MRLAGPIIRIHRDAATRIRGDPGGGQIQFIHVAHPPHGVEQGIARNFFVAVQSVDETPDGKVVANLQSNKKVPGDALLYAVGRMSNVDELNLPAAGIASDSRGRIPVDADYRTCQPHIFAVGDVIGFPSLASVSMEQGRIAAAKALGLPVHSNPANYPYGIYSIPEISFLGKTEEQLTNEDVPYEVGIAYYR